MKRNGQTDIILPPAQASLVVTSQRTQHAHFHLLNWKQEVLLVTGILRSEPMWILRKNYFEIAILHICPEYAVLCYLQLNSVENNTLVSEFATV